MAEQTSPVRRKAALKIIKPGMDTKEVVARFEAERQALALMDHPNIAQVLDAGATETGRPYFVMELVPGVPITEFCQVNQLSIAERLQLFRLVCQAIQSAHQKGIIHRDIKPSNVLVTLHNGVPHPMVIDFGVARAINQKLTEKTLFTNFATMIGTPAYMSPEQAEMSKLDVDTRSDIYSLGVLLYELLTGSTPFPEEHLRSLAYGEMQRVIAEEEPERPSTRLRKSAVAKSKIPNPKSEIDSDLDWIVMKCLEKDRARRYDTANGLAMDIQRHLNNEPIVARPPSAAYRFQKMVRRNKLKFATAAFAVGVLLLAVLVSAWQAVKATRAERKAQDQAELAKQESEKARSIKDFLVQQLLGVNPLMEAEQDPNRRALIDKLERAIGPTFTNQPVIEAEVRFALAEAYLGLDDRTNGTRQIEKVLEVRRRKFGLTNSDTLFALASVAYGYLSTGRPGEADQLLKEGLAVVRAAPHSLSSGEAEVLFTCAAALQSERKPAEALLLLQEAMPVAQQNADPKSWRFKNKQVFFARVLGEAGRIQEAEALFAEGIRQCEREGHPKLNDFLLFQGYFFLLHAKRFDQAQAVFERLLPLYSQSRGSNFLHACDVEYLLAMTHDRQGHTNDAIRFYQSVYPRILKNFFPLPHARGKCMDIAEFFVRNRLIEDAKSVLGAYTNFFETNPPSTPADLRQFGRVEFFLGQISEQEGRRDDAASFYKRAADAGYVRPKLNPEPKP
jgi:tetratricopeptide (TPR) repeat protein